MFSDGWISIFLRITPHKELGAVYNRGSWFLLSDCNIHFFLK
jgi:hypothetical protein